MLGMLSMRWQTPLVLPHSGHRALSPWLRDFVPAQPLSAWDSWFDSLQLYLECFFRSALLLYLLAVARILFYCAPLVRGDNGGNCLIRDGRRALCGAPIVLALFWFLPLCHAMHQAHGQRLNVGSGTGLVPGTEGSLQRTWPGSGHPDLSDLSASQVTLPSGHVPASLAIDEHGSVRAVAIMYRFQRSPTFAAEWIDPEDPVSLVVQGFREAFLDEDSEEVLFPVVPQPLNQLVTFVAAPPWTVDLLLTPLLFLVLTGDAEICFAEQLPGRLTSEDVCRAVGHLWPPGGKVFVGDALGALDDDAVVHVRPGTLITVCGPGRSFPLTHPLAHKLREPKFWFRDFEELGFPEEPPASAQIGLLGASCDGEVLSLGTAATSAQVRAEVARSLGLRPDAFSLVLPTQRVWDLSLRGSLVKEVVGVLPRTLAGCVAVFVDARCLAAPVKLVFLPPFGINVSALLNLVGAHRPLHRRLAIAGARSFCNVSESITPEQGSVVSFSIVPRWREHLPDPFAFPPARPGTDNSGFREHPGEGHSLDGAGLPATGSLGQEPSMLTSPGTSFCPPGQGGTGTTPLSHLASCTALSVSEVSGPTEIPPAKCHTAAGPATVPLTHTASFDITGPLTDVAGRAEDDAIDPGALPSVAGAPAERAAVPPQTQSSCSANPVGLRQASCPCFPDSRMSNQVQLLAIKSPPRPVCATSFGQQCGPSREVAAWASPSYVISLEERDLQLQQPSSFLPFQIFPRHATEAQGLLEGINEQVESSAPTEDPSAEFVPTEWSLGIRILSFQQRPAYATCWVAEGESVTSWLERATILLAEPGNFMDLMVPNVQVGDGMITVLLAPRWWQQIGKHAVLVARAGDGRESHVAVSQGHMTVEELLPLHGQLTSEMVDAFLDEEGPATMDEAWHPPPASSIIFQEVGLAEPELPLLSQVLADSRLEMRNSDLPDSPLAPPLRWLLLGPGAEQVICEVEGGALLPQIASEASLAVTCQRGLFSDLAVRGIPVHKCVSFRNRSFLRTANPITIFIDGRLLGVPVCAAVVGKRTFTAAEVAQLVHASVPSSLQICFSGGSLILHSPPTRSFCNGDSVVLWVQSAAVEARHAVGPLIASGSLDAPDASPSAGFSPTVSTSRRSRSPRRLASGPSSGSDYRPTAAFGSLPQPSLQNAFAQSACLHPVLARPFGGPTDADNTCVRAACADAGLAEGGERPSSPPVDLLPKLPVCRQIPTPCRNIVRVPQPQSDRSFDPVLHLGGPAQPSCHLSLHSSASLHLPPMCFSAFSDQACDACPRIGTSGESVYIPSQELYFAPLPDFFDSPAATILQDSPAHLRTCHLSQVWDWLCDAARSSGALDSCSGTEANFADPCHEVPAFISLECLLPPAEQMPSVPTTQAGATTYDFFNRVSQPHLLSGSLPEAEHVTQRGAHGLLTGSCRVNWSQAKQIDLFTFASWLHLQQPPPELDKPERFVDWVQAGTPLSRPGPLEELCVHTDGSFRASSQQAGWGAVLLKREASSTSVEGTLIGCAWGSCEDFHSLLPALRHELDAHLMESLGLFWAAVMVIQLRHFGPVVFESDCQSAIDAARGVCKTRDHPFCQAMAALHFCLKVMLPEPPRYAHIAGHSGLARNELADALANFGADGHMGLAPFQLDLGLWFHGQTDGFAWAPLAFLCKEAPSCLPEFKDGLIEWTTGIPSFSQDPLEAVRPFMPARVFSPEATLQVDSRLRLRFVSYNALSLVEAGSQALRARAPGLYGAVGRVGLLTECLHRHGVLFAGIQEARTPSGTSVSNGFLRLSSGPDEHGNLGLEVWFSLQTALGLGGGSKLRIQRSDATVLHSEPSCMIVRLSSIALKANFACLHGPHRAQTLKTRLDWWYRVGKLLAAADDGLPWILAMDANIRVGAETSPSIGPHHADPTDEVADVAHALFRRMQVYLPSTFEHFMRGPGGTLLQKRNQQLDRSDFLGLPLSWFDQQQHAWVEPDISVGHRCIDHYAVAVEVRPVAASKRRPPAHVWSIDADAIRRDDNRDKIRRIIEATPPCPWHVNVHEHVAQVVKHLQTELSSAFPKPLRRPKPSFLTDDTKGLHKAVNVTRAQLRQRLCALRLARLRCAFASWRGSGLKLPYIDLLTCTWFSRLHCNIALDVFRIQTFGTVLRKSCRQDKAAHIDALAAQLKDAPPNEVHAAFKELVRPSKRQCGQPTPLPRLQKLDGTYCKDFVEVQERWRQHFSMLEAGEPVSPRSLVVKCFHGQQARGSALCLPGDRIPSPMDLSAAMRCTAGCQKFGNELAMIWFPVMLKTLVHSAESIGLKGATLCRIPKPTGCRTTCLSHRAIVIQSCFGKVMHRALRHLLVSKLDSIAHPLVFGGRAGQSSCFGAVLARSFVRFAKQARISASIVFCDLASAYYGVVRELLVGVDGQSPSIQDICAGLSLSDEDLQMMAHLASEEPALSSTDEFLQKVVQEAGHCSWFIMSQDDQPIHTRRGTRPGGPIADLLFGILFVRTLQARKATANPQHTPRFRWDGQRQLLPAPGPLADLPLLDVKDIVYADDLSVCNVCGAAKDIGRVTCHETGRVFDAFSGSGFVVNLGPTKTAAVVMPYGAGARSARQDLYCTKRGALPVLRENSGGVSLPLVHQYKHLGSLLPHNGSMSAEIRRRLSLARAAFKEGKRAVFACRAVPVARRASLFQGRVLSVLFFGAGGWPSLGEGEFKDLAGGFLSLCRQLLSIPKTADMHWSEAQILFAVGLPGPGICLRVERLRFLCLLVRTAPDTLWAVIRHDPTFLAAQRDALSWIFSNAGERAGLPHPFEDWQAWTELIRSTPGRFKGLIRRAAISEVCRSGALSAWESCVRNVWSSVKDKNGEEVAEPVTHGCLLCKLSFPCLQSWGSHAARSHGYRSKAQLLTRGTQCQACHRLYSSPPKLTLHLKNSPNCLGYVEGLHLAGRLAAWASEEGHAQAPACRPAAPIVVPTAGPDICHGLLQQLCSSEYDTDEAALRLAVNHVQPLPVLLETVRHALDRDLDAGKLDALRSLQECLVDGCLFDRHRTSVPVSRKGSFLPDLVPFPGLTLGNVGGAYVNHCDALCWCERAGICDGSVSPTRCYDVRAEELLAASGLFCVVERPPLPAKPFWTPPSARIKLLRGHLRWCDMACLLLSCASQLAYSGRPSALCFEGCDAGSFGCLKEWFEHCGASATVGRRSSTFSFHLEFNMPEAHS